MIKARGGTLLWTGDAKAVALGEPDGNQWDYLALVYYPSVAAFIDMMTSADYETRCDPHRRNGCAEHVIICTKEAYSKFKMGMSGYATLASPRRTPGPIIPVVCCCGRSLPPCRTRGRGVWAPAFAGATREIS